MILAANKEGTIAATEKHHTTDLNIEVTGCYVAIADYSRLWTKVLNYFLVAVKTLDVKLHQNENNNQIILL